MKVSVHVTCSERDIAYNQNRCDRLNVRLANDGPLRRNGRRIKDMVRLTITGDQDAVKRVVMAPFGTIEGDHR